jgi:hypothetical protein
MELMEGLVETIIENESGISPETTGDMFQQMLWALD